MFSKAIIVNIFLSFLNIFLKFYLNYYLANSYQESLLIKYFILIDIVTLLSMLTIGFKDTLIRSVGIYGEILSRYLIDGCRYLLMVYIFIIVPFVYLLISTSELALFRYNFFVVELMVLIFIINLFMTHFLLAFRVYSPVSYFEFIRGFFLVFIFFVLINIFLPSDPYKILISSFILSNIFIFLWLYPSIRRLYSRIQNLNNEDFKNISKTQKTIVFSSFSYSSLEYFCSAGIIYFSSILMLLLYGDQNVGDLQIVARPIYLALITIFSYPIFRFLFPEFVNLMKEKNIDKIIKIKEDINKLIIVLGTIIILSCWLFSDELISFLFPKNYEMSSYYVNILVIALPFVVSTSVLFSQIKAQEHFKATFLIRLIGLITFVFCLLIFYLLNFNEISIVYSIVFSSITMFFAAFFYEKGIRTY